MPDPTRVFTRYETTRPDMTMRNDVGYVAPGGRAGMAYAEGQALMVSAHKGPQYNDGGGNWYYPSDAGGYKVIV